MCGAVSALPQHVFMTRYFFKCRDNFIFFTFTLGGGKAERKRLSYLLGIYGP
jgi:hypothetical protein